MILVLNAPVGVGKQKGTFFLDKDAEGQRRHKFDSRRRNKKTKGKVLRSTEF